MIQKFLRKLIAPLLALTPLKPTPNFSIVIAYTKEAYNHDPNIEFVGSCLAVRIPEDPETFKKTFRETFERCYPKSRVVSVTIKPIEGSE